MNIIDTANSVSGGNENKTPVSFTADVAHSRIGFTISHLVISELGGHFSNFQFDFTSKENGFSDADIQLKIPVAEINTGNAIRDEHLKGPEFFDSQQYPFIEFSGKGLTQQTGNKFTLPGHLTIKNSTVEMPLTIIHLGSTTDPMRNQNIEVFQVIAKIDRFSFGIGSEVPEVVIGRTATLNAHIELIGLVS
ncbi:Polyisoprenoid-binding protein YceI [Chitinophaga terrae (ex Kim and Jung 2007)]|uniref:Polyisoprenoid-binding protein YceI n=1 Tax=Chitinophaga terrae (ex Kim and Jung 2007) TaxID=408074 RepID=A0A1H4GMM7_9BACT|nr:YceI family protein [Chitinophaga terrae (ex Kim and Jung 2007)]MDQ0110351.1 polyisoprenoid-binding protein YceI [Chitinophaga terrae (ex Kim and Jung 2007)]GEP93648.1 polyisoprenoid-binding protein [Chitinophaga terrae (ex Kim and Jung 2007)]SEB10853.1 Polyisoprenoid-binding protein YceI [Chitinophaga terrae (ex Kim and Jung 2007)]